MFFVNNPISVSLVIDINSNSNYLQKGAFTFDVCSGRGEWGTPKADAVREVA